MCLIVIGSILAALGIYGAIGYQEYKNNKEYNHVYIPLVEMNNEKVKHIEFLPNNYIMVVMDNNRTYDGYINDVQQQLKHKLNIDMNIINMSKGDFNKKIVHIRYDPFNFGYYIIVMCDGQSVAGTKDQIERVLKYQYSLDIDIEEEYLKTRIYNHIDYKHHGEVKKRMNNRLLIANEKKEIDNILLKSMNDRSKLIDEFKKEIDSDEDDNKKIN
jgi:hypothetical protein